ncbi:TnsD family Tn7-like transposition protein [Pseudomonas sp. URMO17WK12:I11]|uniref:TnsD family Tn7-like transposition protein n=1 Tax=Pseudomonas sp. URMO17WK12:I11 TaxID=1283291 RepID=UPI0018D64AF3|nr:TnsD family Tn7-like transposition protein [Pseudomonas sp. URMO17WK12:I11]MBH3362214.1 TniQ family protein [Pseudomonas sp. URMO17WK12:I11]
MKPSTRPPPFLNWLDDETFFSLGSRQHFFLRNRSAIDTLEQIFEARVTYYTHDFPCNLKNLVSKARMAWGNAENIIFEHTITPIFFPFQSERSQEAVVAALSGSQLGSIKYKIGLIAGRFGGEHPLKACLDCIINDRTTYGLSYWHLSHQYPGVLICPKHGCLLRESSTNRQWGTRFQWALPSEDELVVPPWPPLSDKVQSALVDLGNAARSLAQYGKHRRFDASTVAQVYKTALNPMKHRGPEKVQLAREFTEFCSLFRRFWPFHSLPSSCHEATLYINQMLRCPRRYSHPLKHLILIQWIFGSFDDFITAYRYSKKTDSELVRNSASAAVHATSDRLEIDIFLRNTKKTKPKKLFAPLKDSILVELKKGIDKHEITAKFGVSVSTINRLLRANPHARQARSDLRFCELREKHCNIWRSAVRENPDFGAKRIRSLLPSSYAWLYRNDRSWLADQCSRLPKDRLSQPRQLDWATRDEQLSVSIERVIRKLAPGYKKEEIFLLIPRLSAALEKRVRYPKARKLLGDN